MVKKRVYGAIHNVGEQNRQRVGTKHLCVEVGMIIWILYCCLVFRLAGGPQNIEVDTY